MLKDKIKKKTPKKIQSKEKKTGRWNFKTKGTLSGSTLKTLNRILT
jgi:hypothetical protein